MRFGNDGRALPVSLLCPKRMTFLACNARFFPADSCIVPMFVSRVARRNHI